METDTEGYTPEEENYVWKEDKNGKSYYVTAKFRKYDTLEESFEDNGQKLREGVS